MPLKGCCSLLINVHNKNQDGPLNS